MDIESSAGVTHSDRILAANSFLSDRDDNEKMRYK